MLLQDIVSLVEILARRQAAPCHRRSQIGGLSQARIADGEADALLAAGLDPRHALAGCHRNGAYSAINQFYADACLRRRLALE